MPDANHTTETERAEWLLRRIFELEAQYQGGIIKARSRDDYLRSHLVPIVKEELEQAYDRGYATAY